MKELSICADLKSAAARGNEGKRLNALSEFENFGRQTDGLRRVVSNHAVFDRHVGFHFELLSEVNVIGSAKAGQEMCVCDDLRGPSLSLGMTRWRRRRASVVVDLVRGP